MDFILPLRREGKRPLLYMLELVPESADLKAAEFYWIEHFRALGQADLNVVKRQSEASLLRIEIEMLKARVRELEDALGLV